MARKKLTEEIINEYLDKLAYKCAEHSCSPFPPDLASIARRRAELAHSFYFLLSTGAFESSTFKIVKGQLYQVGSYVICYNALDDHYYFDGLQQTGIVTL